MLKKLKSKVQEKRQSLSLSSRIGHGPAPTSPGAQGKETHPCEEQFCTNEAAYFDIVYGWYCTAHECPERHCTLRQNRCSEHKPPYNTPKPSVLPGSEYACRVPGCAGKRTEPGQHYYCDQHGCEVKGCNGLRDPCSWHSPRRYVSVADTATSSTGGAGLWTFIPSTSGGLVAGPAVVVRPDSVASSSETPPETVTVPTAPASEDDTQQKPKYKYICLAARCENPRASTHPHAHYCTTHQCSPNCFHPRRTCPDHKERPAQEPKPPTKLSDHREQPAQEPTPPTKPSEPANDNNSLILPPRPRIARPLFIEDLDDWHPCQFPDCLERAISLSSRVCSTHGPDWNREVEAPATFVDNPEHRTESITWFQANPETTRPAGPSQNRESAEMSSLEMRLQKLRGSTVPTLAAPAEEAKCGWRPCKNRPSRPSDFCFETHGCRFRNCLNPRASAHDARIPHKYCRVHIESWVNPNNGGGALRLREREKESYRVYAS